MVVNKYLFLWRPMGHYRLEGLVTGFLMNKTEAKEGTKEGAHFKFSFQQPRIYYVNSLVRFFFAFQRLGGGTTELGVGWPFLGPLNARGFTHKLGTLSQLDRNTFSVHRALGKRRINGSRSPQDLFRLGITKGKIGQGYFRNWRENLGAGVKTLFRAAKLFRR